MIGGVEWERIHVGHVATSLKYMVKDHTNTVRCTELAMRNVVLEHCDNLESGAEKLGHQPCVRYVARILLPIVPMLRLVPRNVGDSILTNEPENRSNGIEGSASIVVLKSLDGQTDAENVVRKSGLQKFPALKTTVGKADAQKTDMVISIFWLPPKLAKDIVTGQSIIWSGKQRMDHYQRAISSIILMESKTITGLRTWKRCFAKSTITAIVSMTNASWNWKPKTLAYRHN